MDGVPHLERPQPRVGLGHDDRLRQPQHPLGEVPVAAAAVERQRAVGEAPHRYGRRGGDLGERHERGRDPPAVGEERELRANLGAGLGCGALHLGGAVPRGDMRHRPRDPNREPRVSAFDVALVFEPHLEQAAHLGDRRLLAGQERTAHDQVLAGPRHRHVLEPPALLALGLALRLRRGGVADGRTQDAVGIRRAQRHAAVRRDEHVGQAASGALPALVGQDDHVELESLGGMHRHEDDRVAALLGDRGLALPRGQRGLLVTEADEALEVGAAHRLELGREPGELAEVGVAAVAVGHREAREVVVVLGDDQLAQPLERDLARTA